MEYPRTKTDLENASMPPEMVLRVAVAIARRRDAFRPGEKLANGYLDDARTAIAEMLEPTDAMLVRGTKAAAACEADYQSNATWCGMIYAALEETP